MIDHLANAADTFDRKAVLRLTNPHEPHLFVDGDRFMRHLGEEYDYFDVMTFSQSIGFNAPSRNVRRLIYGLKQRGVCIQAKEKRFMLNNHIKLFICYSIDGRDPSYFAPLRDVYIGSQNLTHGTNFNLMYLVSMEHEGFLIKMFDEIWNQLKSQSKT